MDEKQLAERLRHIADAPALTLENRARLHTVADELDRPRPEPGAVVWYWIADDDGPYLGVVDEHENHIARTQWGGIVGLTENNWEPAHILGRDEAAVPKNDIQTIEEMLTAARTRAESERKEET